MNNNFEFVDMADVPKIKAPINKKVIAMKPTTDWKEGKTKKGEKMFYRKYNDKYINIGFLKSGHLWLKYDNAFVKDHGIKNISDEQVKSDVDNILDLIVNFAN